MPLVRLLILIAVIWLLYRLVRRLLPGKPSVTDQSETTRMVKCAHCGVYVAENDTYGKGGDIYCCEDHYHKHRIERSS